MPPIALDLPGVAIGHAEDERGASGVTALVFDAPVIAAISVLGGAPGGRDTGLLEPEMTVETVDALVLSGGSAFGLDAAGGAMAALRAMGRGLAVGPARVPIVPQAILFDLLNGGEKPWLNGVEMPPYWALGKAAVEAAGHETLLGSVGAGLGATTANLKGGLGIAAAETGSGLKLLAIMVVNAIGSATIGDSPHFWAAPYEKGAEFGGLGWPQSLPEAALALNLKGHAREPATSIGAVITNAQLTKAQAKRLAIMAQDGLARATRPAHAPMDGDTIFVAATGAVPLANPLHSLTELGMRAGDCVARAIARGVYEAEALPFPGAVPDWKSAYAKRSNA